MCGKRTVVTRCNLVGKHTKSCGCGQKTHKTLANDLASFREYYRNYRMGSKYRNLEFLLTEDEFRIITSQPCKYCGSPPTPRYVSHSRKIIESVPYLRNGIDRVDNTTGYVVNNCVPCCFLCNYMKRDMSVNDFIYHLRSIIAFQDRRRGMSSG